jgi:hypothetical protein
VSDNTHDLNLSQVKKTVFTGKTDVISVHRFEASFHALSTLSSFTYHSKRNFSGYYCLFHVFVMIMSHYQTVTNLHSSVMYRDDTIPLFVSKFICSLSTLNRRNGDRYFYSLTDCDGVVLSDFTSVKDQISVWLSQAQQISEKDYSRITFSQEGKVTKAQVILTLEKLLDC